MHEITADDVKSVITEKGFATVGHHKCCLCGHRVGYVIAGDNVFFDAGCRCSGRSNYRSSSFEDIARNFNMQKPEVKARMWADFLEGKPLID